MNEELPLTSAKVTMRDVAREADVAIGTVSRVLNLHKDVGGDLVRRVMDAVRLTGYTHAARLRAKGRVRRPAKTGGDVGALFFGSGDILGRREAVRVLDGIERALAAKGRNLVVGSVSRDMPVPRFLTSHRVDGVLLINPGLDEPETGSVEKAYECVRNVPHVWINTRPFPAGGDLCGPDVQRSGLLAAEYLAGKGHRCVGFFDADARAHDSLLMQSSFSTGASRHALHIWLGETLGTGDVGKPREISFVESFIKAVAGRRPTALFVPSYTVAQQFAERFSRAGYALGKAVSLLTCRPERLEADRGGGRPLTMIDMRLDSLSQGAVERLLWRMSNPAKDTDWFNLSVEPVVIECGSVARLG